MPRGRRSYPLEFRRRIVELVRVGRRPGELAREFEPTVESINRWVKQADRDEGRLADGSRVGSVRRCVGCAVRTGS